MNDQHQKVAIITGAGRGMGAVIAERLARDGISVVVNYASSADAAEALVARIEAQGGRALPAQADVSDPAQVARMFENVVAALGGVDILVNNAGIMPVGMLADFDDASFNRLIDTNLKGSFNTMREASRRLRDGGRVVNFSSSVVGLYQPSFGIYAATKAAIEALTVVMAREMAGRNITVNAVAPGPVQTELLSHSPQPVLDNLARMTPLGRLGQPADIASVIAFLAGEGGGWINGQTIRVNGGII
ncbi:SDR family oxidoreductase [Sphingomonas quercus]|uniref:SDR family oxidoreductase n=1 Tax=Sphingomonas quercus TaxID=2842451 RepID=A0ABS6BIG7_9SPHN|nr:SDR family oxidoreductase [Sphingomonas quercus]MBU3077392.1 SDR family oxidoreductase [Sphingomonas quercus]